MMIFLEESRIGRYVQCPPDACDVVGGEGLVGPGANRIGLSAGKRSSRKRKKRSSRSLAQLAVGYTTIGMAS